MDSIERRCKDAATDQRCVAVTSTVLRWYRAMRRPGELGINPRSCERFHVESHADANCDGVIRSLRVLTSRHASCCPRIIMINTCLRSMLWLLLLAPAVAQAQAQTPKPVPFPGESLVGKESFEAYCSSCHGTDGRGNGPVAGSLRNIPTDLTALANRNGDSFPRERVTAVLMGTSRTVVAHGTQAMPIWGPMFRMFESDARAKRSHRQSRRAHRDAAGQVEPACRCGQEPVSRLLRRLSWRRCPRCGPAGQRTAPSTTESDVVCGP